MLSGFEKLNETEVAELKKKHSLPFVIELHAVDKYAGEGFAYVKPVTRHQYAKFKSDAAERDSSAVYNMLCDVLVHPAMERLGPVYEEYPGFVDQLGDVALKTTGVMADITAKKL